MSSVQQFILTVPPADCRRASAFGVPLAHMAYRIGANGQLHRAALPGAVCCGLMVLDADGFDGHGDPSQLCRQIIHECTARHFGGILCDFDGPPLLFLEKLVARLGPLTSQRGWNLYVTETYAAAGAGTVLIPTALSSGSLKKRLWSAIQTWGAERVALAAQRTAQEYLLPAGVHCGHSLSPGELAQRVQQFSPAIYFDNDLCAHYFTYMEQGAAHFVLFDDSGSLLRKFSLARDLGIQKIFLAYPEVEDILPRLLAE